MNNKTPDEYLTSKDIEYMCNLIDAVVQKIQIKHHDYYYGVPISKSWHLLPLTVQIVQRLEDLLKDIEDMYEPIENWEQHKTFIEYSEAGEIVVKCKTYTYEDYNRFVNDLLLFIKK